MAVLVTGLSFDGHRGASRLLHEDIEERADGAALGIFPCFEVTQGDGLFFAAGWLFRFHGTLCFLVFVVMTC